MRRVFHEEGLLGYYRGILPSMISVSHGSIQFLIYEQLKNLRNRSGRTTVAGVDNANILTASTTSKSLAMITTYPLQVLRSRMQSQDMAKTPGRFLSLTSAIWREEGMRGFYRGIGPALLRVLPSTAITLLVYENARLYLLIREFPEC
jgi:solute carrier family 25 (mitochondrial folate transporter), member 32